MPEAGERRCSAMTKMGERCPHWAIRGTEVQYGMLLCPVHVPEGDARKIYQRWPGEGERRCRARTLDGKRCRHWALVEEAANGLCWLHAYPTQHPQIRHGYYRRIPYFPEHIQDYIGELAREGEPLSAETLVVRLKLRGLLAYLGRQDLSEAERVRVSRLIFRGVTTVSRLLQARKKLVDADWGPATAGGAGRLLELIVENGTTEGTERTEGD